MGHLVRFDRGNHVGARGMVMKDVVLDLVVVGETEFAVRALSRQFVHTTVVAD